MTGGSGAGFGEIRSAPYMNTMGKGEYLPPAVLKPPHRDGSSRP